MVTGAIRRPNRLSLEKSPYLQQHRLNPVGWYPWGEEAFERARAEDKPIFLSIGYSTCYWCHVMERDSFEDEQVADVLNRHFVAIKVDREERPDIDQLYMDAVVALTGQGGWPMSVFLTPDLRPFWGGTFFPKDKFVRILEKLAELWTDQRAQIVNSAEQICGALAERWECGGEKTEGEDFIQLAFESLARSFDEANGGFGSAPKFPQPQQLSLLLRCHLLTGESRALQMVVETLTHMAYGGIFDHLGGGFSRYSTDAVWLVPHFEKMLYDNAQIAFTLLETYQVSRNPLFSSVARETLDYMLSEMRAAEGGFYSAQDAGEVGREGEFYVWRLDEIRSLLPAEEFEEFTGAFAVVEEGNFEGGSNVLALKADFDWARRDRGLVGAARQRLLEQRNRRARPHLDDKVIVAWNALAITALCKGYQVLGDSRYLESAQACASFLRSRLMPNGELVHSFCAGKADGRAFLDDFACLIESLLHLYESSFEGSWLIWARELQRHLDSRLWDEVQGGYFFSDAPELLVRKKDLFDGAVPAGNAVAALNLLRLERFFPGQGYARKAGRIYELATEHLARYPHALSRLLWAEVFRRKDALEIVAVEAAPGQIARADLRKLQQPFSPNLVLMLSSPESPEFSEGAAARPALNAKPTFYVCQGQRCLAPCSELEAVLGSFQSK